MKLKFILGLFFVFSVFIANAQRASFSLGPEVNLPTGNATNLSNIGIGFYIKAELAIADRFAVTATAGLNTFYGKKVISNIHTGNLSYAPLRAGIKYYLAEGFYVEGQAGASFSLKKDYKTTFIWAPGIGTFLNTKRGNRFDFGLRYEAQQNSVQYTLATGNISSFGYLGLRAGFVF